MIRPLRWLCASTVVLAACAPVPAASSSPSPSPVVSPISADAVDADSLAGRVNALADERLRVLLAREPELATYLGIPGSRHDALADRSVATLAWQETEDDAEIARLRALDPAPLRGRPEWVTYGFLREDAEARAQARICRRERMAGIDQMFGWHLGLGQLAEVQPVGTDSARAQAISRARAISGFIDTEIAQLREGLRLGYGVPAVNVRRVLQQVDALLAIPPAESPFASPMRRDSVREFRARFEPVVADEVYPALRRFRAFLADEYLPNTRESVGIAAIPDGEACYRTQVRAFTTLDRAPREIHEIGLREMERIQGEMRMVAMRGFGTSDVPALLEALRTDLRYLFRTREEIEAYAGAALARGREAMPRWFGRLPRADVRIEPYPAFEEASAAAASYMPPSEDGSRPGIYRINTSEPQRRSRAGIEATAFHEAIPGHHLQLAIAQEREGGHPLTRLLVNAGFGEGWGLYAERLADEMGLYSGDVDRMGLLSNEALRAARLVVDPGIHVMGWSREQAIDYLLRHTAESRASVENEVDRYIGWPGQATAYMLGNLEIRALRGEAERALGDRFDIRAFHDRVLEDGSVTLPMLRTKIEAWIAEEQARGH